MTDEFIIQRAERKQARARVALTGVSNSGKTMSSLLMAKGLIEYMLAEGQLHGTIHGKIGLIDTERRSASLYAHLCPYDVIELDPPYTTARYKKALNTFENAGYVAVIMDSTSHAWMGQGGILNQVDELSKTGGHGMNAWRDVSGDEQEFWEAILASPAHLFCTMRSKSAYVLTPQTDRGGNTKVMPKKVGMKPIQREGFEFEFTIGLELDLATHKATAFKDRTELFKENSVVLTEEWGARLGHWLYSGADSTMLAPDIKPLEHMYATAGRLERDIDRAANVPDLAAQWEMGNKALRESIAKLDKGDQQEGLEALSRLVRLKDARKATLSPTPPPPALSPISVDDAQMLEEYVLSRLGSATSTLEEFRVMRFSQLGDDDVEGVKAWVAAQAALSVSEMEDGSL